VFRYFRYIKVKEQLLMILLAILMGIFAGYGAVGFRKLIALVEHVSFHELLTFLKTTSLKKYAIVLIPAIGGLFVGPIITFFPEEAKGHGVPEVMEAILTKRGVIKPRTVILRAVASAISIGSGGSVGREGPIVQIGSAVGSSVGQIWKLRGNPLKILVGCGAAGGIAATFNAPIAGFIFANEVILGDFSLSTVSPIILSSVAATAVSRHYLGAYPAFMVPQYELLNAVELFFYALLGILVSFVAFFYVRSIYWLEDFFEERLKSIPSFLKPALGGLVVGAVAILFPQVLGIGYYFMEEAMKGHMSLTLMVSLAIAKIFSTSVTIGSGGSGGVFAPALFIGAMTGGTFGMILNQVFPHLVAPVGCYALVGMGGVFAAAAFAPLTAILILFELTNNYTVILPIMIVCVISYVHGRWMRKYSIYTLKLHRKGVKVEAPSEVNIMQAILVEEAMDKDFVAVSPDTSLAKLADIIHKTGQSYFPVTEKENILRGIITFHDLEPTLFITGLEKLIIADDLATKKLITTTPSETLYDAIKKMDAAGVRQLPVVDPENSQKLIGMITRKDIVAAYNREMIKRGLG